MIDIDEIIRVRTMSEVLEAMSKVTQRYRDHLDNGGEPKTYIDAVLEITEALTELTIKPKRETSDAHQGHAG